MRDWKENTSVLVSVLLQLHILHSQTDPVASKLKYIVVATAYNQYWLQKRRSTGFQVVYRWNLWGCGYSHHVTTTIESTFFPSSSHSDLNLQWLRNTEWHKVKRAVKLTQRENKLDRCHLWDPSRSPLQEALGKIQPCRHPEKWEISHVMWERCAITEKVVGRNEFSPSRCSKD